MITKYKYLDDDKRSSRILFSVNKCKYKVGKISMIILMVIYCRHFYITLK